MGQAGLERDRTLPTKVDCSARDADGFHLAESDQGYLEPGRISVAHPSPGKGACRVARGDVDGAEDPRSKIKSLKGTNPREQRPAAAGNGRRSERIRRRIKASKWTKLAGKHELVVSTLKQPGRRPSYVGRRKGSFKAVGGSRQPGRRRPSGSRRSCRARHGRR